MTTPNNEMTLNEFTSYLVDKITSTYITERHCVTYTESFTRTLEDWQFRFLVRSYFNLDPEDTTRSAAYNTLFRVCRHLADQNRDEV